MWSQILLAAGTIVFVSACYRELRHLSLPYPPGPRKYPFVRNLFQVPTDQLWLTFARWYREYDSEILHVQVAGMDMVALNTVKAARDLLEKRSAIYSSRPSATMLNDLVGWDWVFALSPYGPKWRQRRKLLTQHVNPNTPQAYEPSELKHVWKMLNGLIDHPEKFLDLTRYLAGAVTISVAYGGDVSLTNDPLLKLAEDAMKSMHEGTSLWMVDIFPSLKHLPTWFPGAGFLRQAAIWRQDLLDFLNIPFEKAYESFKAGKNGESFFSRAMSELDQGDNVDDQQQLIKEVAGTIFVGGSDTTVSALSSFFLAMTCYPEAQRRAQEELDRVVGNNRLPTHSDFASLPYLRVLLKELTRWQPVTPLGFAHALTEDDEYLGYHIPKGSLVFANIWGILQDETLFPEPDEFKPERFLSADGTLNLSPLDPDDVLFGFGRRRCPGRHMAVSTLTLMAASILATFNIEKATNEAGEVIEPTREYIPGTVRHVRPFKCKITPRSQAARDLVYSASQID